MGEEAPFRQRHDGWTPERRTLFLARLAETGCVADACRAVGLSTTNAYRARKRMPDFAGRWDMALATPRPILEQAAFDRAVNGVEVGVHRNGQVVATHRRYSDGLLKFLIERDDKRRDGAARRGWTEPADPDATRDEILRKAAAVRAARRRDEQGELLAWAERMRRDGWAP